MAKAFNRHFQLLFTVALLLFGLFVATVGAQLTTPTDGNEIVLYFNVTDGYGRFVTNLKRENFKVYDGKSFQEIVSFGHEDAPVSVGLLIDTSRSAEYLTGYSFDSLPGFMKACAEGSDFFVMTFATEPKLLVDWKQNGADVLNELRGLTIKTEGGTALFDAIDWGIAKVETGASAKKALLVFSDGMDSRSRVKYKEIKRKLSETDIVLYSLNPGAALDPNKMISIQAGQDMADLASLTGGRTLRHTMGNFDHLVTRAATELRYQYRIGFRPKASTGKQSDDSRKVEIKIVLPPDLEKKISKLTVHRRNAYRVGSSKTK